MLATSGGRQGHDRMSTQLAPEHEGPHVQLAPHEYSNDESIAQIVCYGTSALLLVFRALGL